MPIRAVFFDVGGVLEITPPTGWARRWEMSKGWAEGDIDRRAGDVFAAGSVGALAEADVVARLRDRLALSGAEVTALMDDIWTEYLGSPNQTLIDYMAALRARVSVGIISNSFVGAREREQERYGFEERTDAIAYSHEVGALKPDTAIYLRACDQLDVAPREAVLLDDWLPAVDGARAVGMTAVLFERDDQAITAIEQVLQDAVSRRR